MVQHTSADYLGLMEDHFEARRIRFQYFRPFASGGKLPDRMQPGDGLVLLGGGPGAAPGSCDVPNLDDRVQLGPRLLDAGQARDRYRSRRANPRASRGGKTSDAPLDFSRLAMRRGSGRRPQWLSPSPHPHVVYMRDRPEPPAFARILSEDAAGAPAIFQVGRKPLASSAIPASSSLWQKTLSWSSRRSPENPRPQFVALNQMKREIEDALVPHDDGLIQLMGLMDQLNRVAN